MNISVLHDSKGGLPCFVSLLREQGLDVKRIANVAEQTTQYLDKGARSPLGRPALEAKWYASISAGKPDYSVYDQEDYLAELWACWTFYSRKYLMRLTNPGSMMKGQSVVADVGSPARVLDLGCGFGFTTASLKEIWPKSEVFGTNFLDTPQGRMAQRLGSDWGFSILPDVSAIGQCDVVVAFEYFEHFAAPLAHLAEVLDCTEPKILLVNNTFTSPGLGHFPTYLIDGVPVGGRAVSKKFSAEMIRRGYKRIVTNVWNNRPMYWKRVDRCAT